MHILHLTPYYTPAYAFGGVVRAVEGMARALVRRGHTVTVLTTDALDQQQRITGPLDEWVDGVRVVRMPNVSPWLRGRLNLATPRGMRQAAFDLLPGVDVVHCHEFRTVENLLVTPVAAQLNRPLVLSPHGTLIRSTGRSRLKTLWDRVLSPVVAQRFDVVIALAEPELAEVQAIWPQFGRRRVPTQFDIVPNGVDLDDFAQLPDPAAFRAQYQLGDGPVVLFMGRLHPRKGVDVLVRAFKAARVPGAKLLIVGPDEGMQARLEPLLTGDTILTGYLEGEARLAALAAADLFALPATGEGLSMAVLEAMAAGLPVVLSPGCNLPEAATAGAGQIVPPAVEPLADALNTMLTDPDGLHKMGVSAQALVKDRYTWDSVAGQLESIYQRTIPSHMA